MYFYLERDAMKKPSNRLIKGFILIESLGALAILTFCLLYFYSGQSSFLLKMKEEQLELTAYRILYEEVASACLKSTNQPIVSNISRNGHFQINIDLNQNASVKVSTMNQSVAIFRE